MTASLVLILSVALAGAATLTLPVGGTNPGQLLKASGEITMREPDGPRGQYKHGFRVLNDSAADWQKFYGVQFEVNLPDVREVELTATIQRAQRTAGVSEEPVSGTVRVSGRGWRTITMPWSAFDFEQANFSFLKSVKEFTVTARTDGKPVKFQLRNVRVIKAPVISLESGIRGKSAGRHGTAEYNVVVGNCSNEKQSVTLSFVKYGWEEMVAAVEPGAFQLAPGEARNVKVRVTISDRVPPGGHETQVLQAIGNGNASSASQIKFITASRVPSPFILHTAARWQEVKDKAAKYSWAKAAAEDYIKQARDWQVPEVAKPPKNDPDDTYGPFLFQTAVEKDLLACGYAWRLTGEKIFAEKIALFLRRLSNPTNGYPATLRGCSQSLVQEGHYFQHIAMAYDMAMDAGVFSDADYRQIEATFREFIETIRRANDYGPINNWNVSEICGAFYCSLVLGDLAEAERWFSGPAGLCDQLAKGVMDDGWWNECSISYNTWVASEFTQAALAYEPFGVNFRDMKVPASYSPRVGLASELSGGSAVGGTPEERRKPFGMESHVYGPNRKPYRDIRMMWDSLLPFLDYRSVMIGVNDSTERLVADPTFELAYHVYRDPAYAAVIKNGGGKRDLIFGVPELPEQTPERFRDSAFADNVGLVMLRSQTKGRPIREQIQAALHYGSHGWAHGHFDRTGLLNISRYGRSFFNPEMVWYSYEPFMYKFYVQTSVAKNMVVVDQKMQEASPGDHVLFHSGNAMQVSVVETETCWSHPPYGGMVYDYVPVKTFEEKTWREGRHVPIPTNAPGYGKLTEFTEKIFQRRAMIVTDDYIVLADYVKGANAHTFESLFQMKGFQGLEAAEKKFLRHDAQWNPDPRGSAQFHTDCDWFAVTAPAKASFEMLFGNKPVNGRLPDNAGTRTLHNEDGALKFDVHSLWPQRQEVMINMVPEQHDVEKRLFYAVRGDGQTLADGKFGAWILGSADIDVPLAGVKQLELETRTELSSKPTLFWANARVVTKDGKEVPLAELAPKFENIEQPKEPGKDYFGGPIKIVGNEFKSAVPAQPRKNDENAFVRVDLSGVDAVRFKATLGGDYPLGDESQRRKTLAVRSAPGAEAHFLAVIEPYEDKPVITSAVATGADSLRVELRDGRVQELELSGFTGAGKDIRVAIRETKDGQVVRRETAGPAAGK